ncbi:MAG: glutamyl-tRNA(Gln) amidotransferase subunit A [Cyclobacteriaceae bacterium]|nr:MAG: glutamyl-tRNA(Gln) amidotransferase subunit A [Cyclobacteriaceae bacterium]
MLARYTLTQLQQLLYTGKISCRDIVQYHLQRTEQCAHLNAFVRTYPHEALAQAEAIDKKIRQRKAGKLAGLVAGIKDNIVYRNHPAQAASRILQGFTSTYHATAVARLINEDAIIIGHQNCDEFGMGSSSENSVYGPVRNGLDPALTAGGSSGGSAVAVQTDMCRISLGSDTGGSVRQPASFCGVLGLKPTYGRISRHGLIAYASSLDCIGILGNHAEDLALVLETIAGKDEYDSTTSGLPVHGYSKNIITENNPRWRIAFYAGLTDNPNLQPEVRRCFGTILERIQAKGADVQPVHFPLFEYMLPAYYLLASAEASSNLARYDGVRYGYSSNATSTNVAYRQTRTQGFGAEVKRRIMLGAFVLTSDYYNAYYIKAQQVRRLIRDETFKILQEFDFIITPTAPTTAFKLGAQHANPVQAYLADVFSVQANMAGIPAISVPCGKDQAGMPIGIQLMAHTFQEQKLLQAALWLHQLKQV